MLTRTLLSAALLVSLATSASAYDLLNDWPTKFKTASGLEFGVRGNYQVESNRFSDDKLSNGNDRFEDLQTWRRKEFYLYAKKNGVWEVASGYDFQARLWVDNYFKLYTKNAGDFRFGQAKSAVGFDEGATGSGATTFIERALPVQAVNQGRRIGVDWSYEKIPGWLLYAGLLRGDLNGDNDGHTTVARAVFNPVKSESEVVHLGVAASAEQRDDEIARVRVRPEANLTPIRLIDSGNLSHTDRIDRVGLEGAWKSGPWSVQSEYLTLDARRDGLADYRADGFYVYGSWVLTGESRAYKSGAFGNVKPAHDYGAVEVALRYSTLDLNDGTVHGGKEHDWTLGVNWYVGQHLKLQANYIRAFSDKGALALDPTIVDLRAQVYF
ncbi:MAG: porin [Tahibacter sp.]